eukprot:13737.XXX_1117353_1117577_1 [CDS] Oithona nana genome sequencing.
MVIWTIATSGILMVLRYIDRRSHQSRVVVGKKARFARVPTFIARKSHGGRCLRCQGVVLGSKIIHFTILLMRYR